MTAIKTLASILRPRLRHLPKLAFSSSAAVDSPPAKLVPANISRESVIYGLKKLDKTPAEALDLFRWVESQNPAQLGETAYELILRILARQDSVKDFWVLLREMQEKENEIDMETFDSLFGCLAREKLSEDVATLRALYARLTKTRESDTTFKAAVAVILGSEWCGGVEKRLREVAFPVTDATCLRMLRALQSDPVKASAFFRWAAGTGNGYKHSSTAYNAMAKILGKNGLLSQFWNFVEELKSVGFYIDFDTYVKLIRHFQKKKMIKEVVHLFEMMVAGPYKPSAKDCGELLRQLSRGDGVDFELVSRVRRVYETYGGRMTKSVFDGIHMAFTRIGRFDAAQEVMQGMSQAGHMPDNITYSHLVFGLCKFGKLEDACKVLDDMDKLGCQPDVKTWAILIHGYCSVGEVDQALHLLLKMMESNCRPDANILEVLAKALLGKGDVDGAYILCTQVADLTRVELEQATYNLLIDKLIEARKMEEGLNVLCCMKKNCMAPYLDVFVSYISKSGTVQDALNYLECLKVLTKRDVANVGYYKQVLQALLKEGRHFDAEDLLCKSPHVIQSDGEIRDLFVRAKKP